MTTPRPAQLFAILLLPVLTMGCGDKSSSTDVVDADHDGFDSTVDCDDLDPDVNPEGSEICDGVDNDCDGLTDDADDSVDTTAGGTWYADADFDGYGDAATSLVACDPPAGYTADDSDCDDSDDSRHPGATEVCDEVDNDCDDQVDEDGGGGTWFTDADHDGYGDDATTVTGCTQPAGSVDVGGDCDDADADISPAAAELCDGIDNDCDDVIDGDGLVSFQTVDGYTDITDSFTGTSRTPATPTLSDDGTVWFCDGTYFANVDVAANVTLRSQSASWDSVVLDGAGTGTIVQVTTGGTEVGLYDLTITNGNGESSAYYGSGAGGGISCEVAATVTGSGLYMQNNLAYYGGAIQSLGCDLTLSDSILDDNQVTGNGGAMSLIGGSYVIDNTELTNNGAGSTGGAIYSQGYSDVASIELNDVIFDSNNDNYNAGALYAYYTDLTMTGSSSGAAAFTNNTSRYGYGVGYFYPASSTATVSFDNVDFGSAASGNDNSIAEIYQPYYNRPYVADDTATFSCDYLSCGRSTTHTVGATTNSLALYNNLYGNVVLADNYATIDNFSVYVGYNYGCTADLYIASTDTAPSTTAQTWTIDWQDTDNVITATGWLAGSGVSLLAEPGRYYAFMVGMRCDTSGDNVYYGSFTGSSVGFGSTVGYVYPATGYSAVLSGSTSLYTSASTVEFYMYVGETEL